MTPRVSLAAAALVLALISGLAMALPVAHGASSTVTVSIPAGAGNPNGAPGYAPATVVVVIGVNNTVVWTNNDTAHHTVSPSNVPAGATWSPGSGDMAPKAVYSFTFTAPGNYTYTCVYHSWMGGTVVVKPASAVPEFPVASLAAILFVVIAAVMLAAPRLRPGRLTPGT